MLPLERLNEKDSKLLGALGGGLMAILSLFPPFSVGIGAWEGYQAKRMAEFIEELSKKITSIEKQKIDNKYIESEEFIYLIQKGLKVLQQHRSKLKAKFIINLIAESVNVDRDRRFNTDLKEIFIELIDSMSDQEQLFLSDFAKGKYNEKSRKDIYQESDRLKAVALDLLFEKGIFKDDETWIKYIVTSMLGREFIDYIRILGNQD